MDDPAWSLYICFAGMGLISATIGAVLLWSGRRAPRGRRCPRCRHTIPPTSAVCSACGYELPADWLQT